jgi:uncharacterized membrane protein
MVVMMLGYGGGWPAWELALMWVGMIAFVGVLVWAVCALVVNATRKPGRDRDTQPGSALGILDERLALGEIDIEEYKRLQDLIGSGRSDSPSGAGGAR